MHLFYELDTAFWPFTRYFCTLGELDHAVRQIISTSIKPPPMLPHNSPSDATAIL